ncbi:pickpocket 13 [Carabus blaptoides fortunei]
MWGCTNWKKTFKFYGENTSIHGISYVANSSYFILERFCWLLVVILSMYGMILIFLASYDAYDTNPISFVTDTSYLQWNTSFPAISICQVMNQDIYWTAEPNAAYSALQTFISEIVFFTGSCYACGKPCAECNKVNMTEVVNRYRKSCTSVLGTCKWNGEPFNCCDKFLPVKTEYGTCFAINSLHAKHTKNSHLRMTSNRFLGPGQLSIESLDDVRVFFHAPEDIPFINADPDKRDDVMLGEKYIKQFNVIEIANDDEVRQVPVRKRGCRFPDEPPPELKVHNFYSYSTCVVQCHADAQMRFCNCTHHLMPNSRMYCEKYHEF